MLEGGVNVYSRNLVNVLVKNGYDVYFLSSGYKYSPFKNSVFVKEIDENIKNLHHYEIINSPVMAPAFTMFKNIRNYSNDVETVKYFENFINNHGPFDVIHFQNLEGISPKVLSLKEKFPKTKFIFSIHNYLPICPLVQLFKNHENKICKDFKNGTECSKCLCFELNECRLYKQGVSRYIDDRYSSKLVRKLVYNAFKIFNCKINFNAIFNKRRLVSSSGDYYSFRKECIIYINKYCDVVLAVSSRVRDICISYGFDSKKIKVSYIGTKIAENQVGERSSKESKESNFVIAYMGQARCDKGFYFLIDTLKSIKKDLAKQITVVLAVKFEERNYLLEQLSGFKEVKLYNGYSHDDITNILKGVTLGVIPVIWEDNLPQVAIEMVANGVPILCSDAGGASELSSSSLFKFKCGDTDELKNRIEEIYVNRSLLKEYWKNHHGLITMDDHLSELENKYY